MGNERYNNNSDGSCSEEEETEDKKDEIVEDFDGKENPKIGAWLVENLERKTEETVEEEIVIELSVNEMEERRRKAEEIILRNKKEELDELSDQLTDLKANDANDNQCAWCKYFSIFPMGLQYVFYRTGIDVSNVKAIVNFVFA